ncbi:MAG: small multi-drug export protein [Candidatus Omnitrophica bacterium]|nr:small multi-drug export protein [Candidatus Omnitrophota bacterium]
MVEHIISLLKGLSKESIVLILGALPISELRGAIPAAIAFGFTPLKAYCVAFIGNVLPIMPLLFLFEPVSNALRRFPLWKRFFDWLFERTKRKASLVERFEAIGLILFVAIPLPITGAWTGCIAATLFKIRFRYAFPAIVCGVAIAGLIVMLLTLAGKSLLS